MVIVSPIMLEFNKYQQYNKKNQLLGMGIHLSQ